jgi:hypothetical protein
MTYLLVIVNVFQTIKILYELQVPYAHIISFKLHYLK